MEGVAYMRAVEWTDHGGGEIHPAVIISADGRPVREVSIFTPAGGREINDAEDADDWARQEALLRMVRHDSLLQSHCDEAWTDLMEIYDGGEQWAEAEKLIM